MINLFCYNPSSTGYNKLNWYGLWFRLPETQRQFNQRGIRLVFEDDKNFVMVLLEMEIHGMREPGLIIHHINTSL